MRVSSEILVDDIEDRIEEALKSSKDGLIGWQWGVVQDPADSTFWLTGSLGDKPVLAIGPFESEAEVLAKSEEYTTDFIAQGGKLEPAELQ